MKMARPTCGPSGQLQLQFRQPSVPWPFATASNGTAPLVRLTFGQLWSSYGWCENVPCEPQASRWCNNLVFWLQSRILCVKGLKCTMWSRWPSCRRVNGIKLRCDLAGHVTHNGPQCFLGTWLRSTVTKKFAWDSSRNTNQRLLRKTTRMDHQKQPDS